MSTIYKGGFSLSLYARKGGVGRTMLTQNLAGACAELGAAVLVIDTDSQASLSKNFLSPIIIERLRPYETTAALFSDQEPVFDDLIHNTSIENISILPASDHLEQFDRPVPGGDEELAYAIRDFVGEVMDRFDIILIDTPPNVSNLPAWAALLASDHVVTPVQPEKNSGEAIIDVKRRLARAIAGGNPGLSDLGYFLNMYDKRLALHNAQAMEIRQLYGNQVFNTIVRQRSVYKEAVFTRKPITHARPKSEEAETVRDLLLEIIERIRSHRERVHQHEVSKVPTSKEATTKNNMRVNE